MDTDKLIKNFNRCIDWEDKYLYIISLGEKYALLPAEKQTEQYAIVGCQSSVWIDVKLIDFKLEFGRLETVNGIQIVLADEISPDTCRLWDVKTEKKLDKDRFRKDLGNIIQGYQEVARRLGIMPEETNISEVNFGKTIPIKFKKK